jgi:hypothetical protein
MSAQCRASVMSYRTSGAIVNQEQHSRAARLLTGTLLIIAAGVIARQR